MLKALRALFELPESETPESLDQRLRLAAAALLVEVARADFNQGLDEDAMLEELLITHFGLEASEVHLMVTEANEAADDATSLYQFTRLINDHYTAEKKLQLIASMWRVAYADNQLDKYEEALIRQVAELTYVSHADYIRTKMEAHES